MSDITTLKRAVVARVLQGNGEAPPGMRRSAFENTGLDEPIRTLVDKVARSAYMVADEDFAAARAAGLSEDQIFEIVVCAAIGEASRQYDHALQVLEAATAGK